MYLVEISKKEKRGSIVVIQQLAIEFGILIMYFVGYGTLRLTSSIRAPLTAGIASCLVRTDLSSGCSFIAGTNSFRTAWAIQFVPCVFLLAGLPFLPRSPRWLAKVGRVDEAIEILARIQAGGDVNDPLVVAEWEEITTILAAERGKRSSTLPSMPISHFPVPIVNPF